MYNRSDPRFRRTINQITHNLESANEATQVGLFSFTEHYIKPCFSSIAASFEPCTAVCFPRREDRLRRQRARSRGRAELNFDFYDDWENDENDALLSLEDDELDRLIGGGSSHTDDSQPRIQRGMNYGSRGDLRHTGPRRRSAGGPFDLRQDPTVIPNQSVFGFFSKLPFKLGGKGLRYKPSAADLQVRPMARDRLVSEQEPVNEEIEEEEADLDRWRTPGRQRSGTTGSGYTADSLSSRGDLFPSDGEDDAVPLDDEFAMVLERRNTYDDTSSSKTKNSQRPGITRKSTGTTSSRSVRGRPGPRSSRSSTPKSRGSESPAAEMPTLLDLKLEEQKVQAEEEGDIERKRDAAQKLAREKGLTFVNNETEHFPPKVNEFDDKAALPSHQFFAAPATGFPFPTTFEDPSADTNIATTPKENTPATRDESTKSSNTPSERSNSTVTSPPPQMKDDT